MALTFDGITKSFGPVEVLRGVSFGVEAGRIHALLGENGAGKSTLMRIVLGMEIADGGSMTLDGAPHRPNSAKHARDAGIVMVPQERTVCGDLSVAENIVLGIEPAFGPFVRQREARAIAARTLALIDASLPLDAPARSLSVSDQQLVEIARALAQATRRARALVLDEPTSSLGKREADRLFARMHALKESGLAVVLVTHVLGDVREHADRYTVLRDGVVCGEGDPRETPTEQIVHEMIGRELEEARALPREARAPGEIVLRHEGLELHRGEIVGIAGIVGSGRTELLHAMARPGMGFSSEDRGGEGLMLGRSIAENIVLSPRGPFFASTRSIVVECARWVNELGIRARDPEQQVGELSGGNQQKVQIARLLREDFEVLFVDEPTRGIDVASKAQILGILRGLADAGKCIVLVSSELEDLVTTCDRVAVLRRGKLGPARPAKDRTAEALLLEAS